MGRIIIVTLLSSGIMGGYNTPDTIVEIGAYSRHNRRDRSVKVGHEIKSAIQIYVYATLLVLFAGKTV